MLLLILSAPAFSQAALSSTANHPSNQLDAKKIQQLYDAGLWEAVIHAVPESSSEPADLELDRGLALAHLHRYPEATAAFRAGLKNHSKDARFFTELAGVAYQQKHLAQARAFLRRSLALNPTDSYANNFLASLYFLDGNLEAALKYWNRSAAPRLSDLSFDPQPPLNPLLLDRMVLFSQGSVWTRQQYLTTQAELTALDLFSRVRFDLTPQPDGAYRLTLHAFPSQGIQLHHPASWLSTLRGLPYQSVNPEFFNLHHRGLNWRSFVRWDDEKRMLTSEVATPMFENPRMRFRLGFDGRNENWNISRTLLPATVSPAGLHFAGFNMERAVVDAQVLSIANGRSQWTLGSEFSDRSFRSLINLPTAATPFFTNSAGIAVQSSVTHSLIRFPERRFILDVSATGEFGSFFTHPLGRYGRMGGSATANWLPQARGDDYATQTQLRVGETFGQVPFDDLFLLGFDRDNPLWMRGHDGLVNGKKGNAPLGRNFFLSNSEIDKIVYRDGIFQVKLGPFVDTGTISDPSAYFGSHKWLTDTGLQAQVGVLGSFTFVLGYGKDLRSGNNTFYTTVLR